MTSVAIMLTATVMGRSIRTINNPACMANPQRNSLNVTKVELSDTATIIWFKAKEKPNNWIRMSGKAFITDDSGKRYAARAITGMSFGKRFYMPETGETDFAVTFSPIPASTKFIDFVEGSDSWKILGIHDSKLNPAKEIAQTDTRAYRIDPARGDSFFRSGTAVVKGKFEGKHPAIVEYSEEDAIYGTSAPLVFEVDSAGAFTASISVKCPMLSRLDFNRRGNICFYAAAGDTVCVSIDKNNHVHYADGTRHKNLLDILSNIDYYLSFIYYDMKAKSETASCAEYMKYLEEKTNRQLLLADYLAGRYSLNNEELHLLKTKIKLACCQLINEFNWKYENSAKGETLNPANYAFMRNMGFDDLTYLSIPFEMYFMCNRYEYCDIICYKEADDIDRMRSTTNDSMKLAVDKAIFGTQSPSLFLQTLWLKQETYKNSTPEAQEKSLGLINSRKEHITIPQYRQFIAHLAERIAQPAGWLYQLPDGKGTDIFNAIVEKYRGKLVLVDFWSTTCGPCIADIKSSQQLRDSIAKHSDIELVFITNDRQSGKSSYTKFVGEHLKGEESYIIPYNDWSYLTSLFKFNGIPHYELIAPDGRMFTTNTLHIGHHNDINTFVRSKNAVLDAFYKKNKKQ